jgi:hypothetical protein
MWSSSLGRSAHQDSHTIYFGIFGHLHEFLCILEVYTIFWNIQTKNQFLEIEKGMNSKGLIPA